MVPQKVFQYLARIVCLNSCKHAYFFVERGEDKERRERNIVVALFMQITASYNVINSSMFDLLMLSHFHIGNIFSHLLAY